MDKHKLGLEKAEVKAKAKAEVKAEAKAEVKAKAPEKLGTLGKNKVLIQSLSKRVLNGIVYNDVHLINGETFLLSDKDLEGQKNI